MKRMHPHSGGRRNPAPAPMADLVPLAKKQKAEIEEYENSSAYKRTSLGIKRKHGGSRK